MHKAILATAVVITCTLGPTFHATAQDQADSGSITPFSQRPVSGDHAYVKPEFIVASSEEDWRTAFRFLSHNNIQGLADMEAAGRAMLTTGYIPVNVVKMTSGFSLTQVEFQGTTFYVDPESLVKNLPAGVEEKTAGSSKKAHRRKSSD